MRIKNRSLCIRNRPLCIVVCPNSHALLPLYPHQLQLQLRGRPVQPRQLSPADVRPGLGALHARAVVRDVPVLPEEEEKEHPDRWTQSKGHSQTGQWIRHAAGTQQRGLAANGRRATPTRARRGTSSEIGFWGVRVGGQFGGHLWARDEDDVVERSEARGGRGQGVQKIELPSARRTDRGRT